MQTQSNQPQIAYLAEASEVNNNCNLRGKSLRCYEVEIHYEAGHYGTIMRPKATGSLFTLKDGKLVKTRTKASMAFKYVNSYRNAVVLDAIDRHTSYGSSLYTAPELAILAKLHSINRDRNTMYKALAKSKAKLDALEPYSDAYFKLAADYPELLI